MSTTTMGPADDSQLMNYLVRMVVPLRREFGRSLDVAQFLHDFAYAKEVIDQALGSQDSRLREYALYVQQRYHGPRVADSPSPAALAARAAAAPAVPASSPSPAEPAQDTAAAEAELRAKMLKKYTSGLR